ncbi:uncharacterized protein LOC144437737 [Glandiceps talaboti]
MRFGATLGGLVLFLFAASEVRGQCTVDSIPQPMPPVNGAWVGSAPTADTADQGTIEVSCDADYILNPANGGTLNCEGTSWNPSSAPTCVEDVDDESSYDDETTASSNVGTTSGDDDGGSDTTTPDSDGEDAAAIPNLNVFLGLTMILVAFFSRMM